MCAGEKETGATNIQNPEYRRARERGSQKGKKKDRTVKTSVFPFIIRNSDKENGPQKDFFFYNEKKKLLHKYANLTYKNAETNLSTSSGVMIGKPMYKRLKLTASDKIAPA